MRFILDVKKLPELVTLSPEQQKHIEGISAFIGCWDWRTMSFLIVSLPFAYLSIGGENEFLKWTFTAIHALFVIAFFVMLMIRWHYHAKRIAKVYKTAQDALPESENQNLPEPPKISILQLVLSRSAFVGGLSMVIASIYFPRWELAVIGVAIVYFGLAVVTSYNACVQCQQVWFHFGQQFNRCNKCGRSFQKIDDVISKT